MEKASADFALNALRVVEMATCEKLSQASKRNPAAVALGRLGGLKGGKARAKAMTPEQRKAIAQKAAETRWGSKKAI